MTRLTNPKKNLSLKAAGIVLGLIAILALAATPAMASDPPKIKVGLVTFLSGGAAGPFGIPARNGSELMIAAINAGKVPAPYNTPGVAGAMLETVLIDEAGNAQKQVTEYRKLIQKQNVDVVIGYISSGHCKAIAPVAEELGTLTIFFDCGTPQIFEDIVTEPKYLFRAPALAIPLLLEKIGWSLADVDLIELNEAFAAQVLADGKALETIGWDWDKVNIHGGAIALGHPIGASGARVLTTLLYALKENDLKRGIASLCLGGSEAVAMAIEII